MERFPHRRSGITPCPEDKLILPRYGQVVKETAVCYNEINFLCIWGRECNYAFPKPIIRTLLPFGGFPERTYPAIATER